MNADYIKIIQEYDKPKMKLTIFLIILFSHIMALRPFIANTQQGKIPNTSHFATLSIILYYDLGLVIEVFEFPDKSGFFTPFFNENDLILFSEFILILIAPWLFHLGANITNKVNSQNSTNYYSRLRNSTKSLFYIIIISISVYYAILGLMEILPNDPIWVVRARIGKKWGALIILLYLPLHFLAFYTRQSDSKAKTGLLFSLGLTVATIFSTIGMGERTNMLLPLLILILFRKNISIFKIVIFLIIGTLAASALLPLFKWQNTDKNSSISELVVETINGDFYRGGVLATTLEKTELVGTNIMPYPMAGYVYSLLYYVPRQIAPFKGWSTSQTFTSDIVRTPVEDTSWGFGVGVIEEILLNVGFLWCIPGLVLYGMGMGLLDKISSRVPSILIPTRLAAIWLCGYDSSALLLTFGTMAIAAFSLHQLFVQKSIRPELANNYILGKKY